MTETRQTSELKMTQKNELNETRRQQINFEQELKRKIQEETYLNGKINLELEKMSRDAAMRMKVIENEKEKEIQKLKNSQ